MNVRFEETKFDLFVPAGADAFGIDPGSAIVAGVSQRGQERVIVHYEGNRYGAQNMRRYDERCLHAAGRAATRYPTVAKSSLPSDQLRVVGTYDLTTRHISVADASALQAWLGQEPIPDEC